MKTLKFVMCVGAFIVGMLGSYHVRAQASIQSNSGVTIYLTKPIVVNGVEIGKDTVYVLTSGAERVVMKSIGKYLRVITFKMDDNHDIMQDFSGPIRVLEVSMEADLEGIGPITLTDEMAVLTKSGNLKFMFHLNGAGNNLPVGWDF